MVLPDPPSAGPHPYGRPMHVRNVLTALRRNLWLILAVVAVTGGFAWYRFSRQLPQYKASALVRLVDVRRSISGGLASGSADFESWRVDPLKSQLEVLKGRSVLGGIVDTMGLRITAVPPDRISAVRSVVSADGPEDASASVHIAFRSDGFTATSAGVAREIAYGAPFTVGAVRFLVSSPPEIAEATVAVVPREAAISALMGRLQLRLREGTDAVDVEYAAFDPLHAREVVNTAIVVFRDASARSSRDESRRRRVFLEEQLQANEGLFREVQNALSDFRVRQQVFSSREQIAAQQEGLRGLDVRREELAADKRIYEAAIAGMTRADGSRSEVLRRLGAAPGLASNAVIAQLYTQLLAQQGARDSLRASGATSAHPDVRRLDNAVASSEERLVDAIRSHVAAIDARIGALDALRARSAGQLQALPATEAEEARLAQQAEAMSRMSDQIREELQRARIAEAVETGQVQIINLAPSAGAVGAPFGVKMAIALFFGFGLGIGAALLRTHLDTTIRDREEIEHILRAPKLATIPRLGAAPARADRIRFFRRNGDTSNRRNALVALDNGGSWEAEAYRTLRTNLIFSQTIRTLKRVVVTSSVPGEGKTTTAGNLAVTYAQQGLRVLLVDCDLRKPAVHRLFDVPSEPGLTQLVLGYASREDVIRETSQERLFVLPAGALPPNPAELLGGPQARAVFDQLSTDYDIVLIDTSPMMAASDAAILASHSDGVLLVVRAGYADRKAVQAAAEQLATVGARVVGAVFNDADSKAWPYEKSYHYKSYHQNT
jgi:polysaccharide biosynthesis transport protein